MNSIALHVKDFVCFCVLQNGITTYALKVVCVDCWEDHVTDEFSLLRLTT